jgi:tRNA uridine 5-carbamoylmethylation protein Kti12
VIGEEALQAKKSAGYSSATNEKVMRASIKSAVGRAVSAGSVVIVDSLNYIKGYRYELYCIAREQSTSTCVVWVTLDDHEAEKRHEMRKAKGEDSYSDAIFHELRQRFEVPVVKNRWEAPLFEVNMAPDEHQNQNDSLFSSTSDSSVFNKLETMTADVAATCISSPVSTPIEGGKKKTTFRRIVKKSQSNDSTITTATATSVSSENKKDGTSLDGALWFSGSTVRRDEVRGHTAVQVCDAIHAYLVDAKTLVASQSTVRVPHGEADLVYELDNVSQQIVTAINTHQRDPSGEGAPVIFKKYDRSLTLNRVVTLAELVRHKKQFVKVNSMYPPSSTSAIGSAFIDFLADCI